MRHLSTALLLATALGLAPSILEASACSQLGHWSWPPEQDAKSFGGSIGNHEGVSVRYYSESKLDGARVIEIERSGFDGTTRYEYRSNRNFVTVSHLDGASPYSYTVATSAPNYGATLTKMRDLLGYAGAPEYYLTPMGSSSDISPEAIYLVGVMDEALSSWGWNDANCILYSSATAPLSSESCRLTAGPLPILGSWDSKAMAVWVRDGYELTLIDREYFDKSAGLATYASWQAENESELAQKVEGGYLFTLRGPLSASSAICRTSRP